MSEPPRYALPEIERRWIVDLAAVGELAAVPHRVFEDLYLEGTRLRLRKVVDPSGTTSFKLGKKYGKRTALTEPITTLYLTEEEHRRLAVLPGAFVSKRRHAIAGGSLDVYELPRERLAIFELELEDEAAATAYVPPPFVTREVTHDPLFTGHALAGRVS